VFLRLDQRMDRPTDAQSLLQRRKSANKKNWSVKDFISQRFYQSISSQTFSPSSLVHRVGHYRAKDNKPDLVFSMIVLCELFIISWTNTKKKHFIFDLSIDQRWYRVANDHRKERVEIIFSISFFHILFDRKFMWPQWPWTLPFPLSCPLFFSRRITL